MKCTCHQTHSEAFYDPSRVVNCATCGENYDHRSVTTHGVRFAHSCGEPVSMVGAKWGPCSRAVHGADVTCVADVVKSMRERVDYNKMAEEVSVEVLADVEPSSVIDPVRAVLEPSSTDDDPVRAVVSSKDDLIRTLHPHQEKAVEEIKNGSVLAGGVGTGKSITALAYYVLKVCEGVLDRSEPMKKPRKLLIITPAKKRDDLDWQSEALHLGLFEDAENSYSGMELVVDSWNNLHKYTDVEDAFFIFDEQRIVGKGKWVKQFLKITKKNQWILLSATPADTWMDYVPVFIANGFYRNHSHFIEEHVVWSFQGRYRKIRGFFGVRKLEKYRDMILVDMPYERHTTRHLIAEPVQFDELTFNRVWKKRWNVYTDEPLVDVAEMHRVGRKVVNSDPDRLTKIKKVFAKHPKLIIFYSFDYELEILRTLHTELDVPVTEWNGHLHNDILKDEDTWIHLVQYQAGAEAWNCIETNAIVYYSLTYSHKAFEQTQGRIDRLNTPYEDLYYYILISTAKIDMLIWRSLVAKRDFHIGRNSKFAHNQERLAA